MFGTFVYWVAAKELKQSQGNKETLGIAIYPYDGNLSPKPPNS